jgi:hypothetical protein
MASIKLTQIKNLSQGNLLHNCSLFLLMAVSQRRKDLRLGGQGQFLIGSSWSLLFGCLLNDLYQ